MRYILVILASLLAGNLSGATAAAAKTLTVYTYDSFVSRWGPGPELKKRFEAICACTLKFVGLGDGVALLSRLKLEGATSRADIALGLDSHILAEARATGLFASHDQDLSRLTVPGGWSDTTFLPYDYGYFAFVYDEKHLKNPPASLWALVDNRDGPRIIIEDPRSSTPGLGLLIWMRQLFGNAAPSAWRTLAPRIVTVTRGWSEAYGLFLKGEADMVLSYTTSPAYHMITEKKDNYRAAAFSEGHMMQIELAAVLKNAPQPHLARSFLAFLLSKEAQSLIPTTNWMYPVTDIGKALPAEFDRLVKVKKSLRVDPDKLRLNRKKWLGEWLDALGR